MLAPKLSACFNKVSAIKCDKFGLWRCVLQGEVDWAPHNRAAVQPVLGGVVFIFF